MNTLISAVKSVMPGSDAPAASSDAPAASSDAPAAEEKKKRGKPKDEHAPPKPKNGFSQFCSGERTRLKEVRPELASDLAGMGTALAEGWAKVPEEEKNRLNAEYEKLMEIWKPKWAVYKTTQHYKEFVEVKTDYLDKKAQKKLVKTMNKDAPKRPKSGYMIFAGEIREQVMEEVKAKGLGLGDAGRLISERWQAISEGKKADYGEQSQKQKIAFDQEFGVYKGTEAFGTFCDAKATLESTQTQKKLVRTLLDEAPKRSPSAYALFRNEAMPPIVKENGEKKENEGKLSMGEMGKKVAELWQNCDATKKAALEKEAEKLKGEYEQAYKEFKANQKYTDYLEKRAKVKTRENALVHLREMPKKPKSVFAMFAKDHKDEVTPGKGEGKGTSALKQKFEQASKEEKDKYAAEQAKLLETWGTQVTDYKSGVKYQTYEKTKDKIIEEFKNEAIKVTTLKFLSDAPAAPAKTPFAIFVGEKRKAAGAAPGEKKSKEAKREEVVQAQAEWGKLGAPVKDAYETKRKELMKAYEDEIKAFMAGDKWQDYQKEAKRLRIPIRSLLFHKKKVIAKLKDGKPNPASVQLPSKPDLFPAKPQNAMQIFIAEKKKTVENVSEISSMWGQLSAEEKASWDAKAAEQAKQFEEDMDAFRKSEDGKRYFREMGVVQRRRKLIDAKNKYMDDLPIKPTSALYQYLKSISNKCRKENPELKGFELKKIMTDRWMALSAEEKEPLETAARQKMEEFERKMSEFKASDNFKKFTAATRVRKFVPTKKKGKAVAVKAPSGPPVPESMPKRPLNAFQAYCKSLAGQGAGGLGDMQKKFAATSEDEKKQFLSEAQERNAKYIQEMQAFEKSREGRKYRTGVAMFAKRKRLKDLRDKFLQDEPKRPQGAYFLFCNLTRGKVIGENPGLKGMGPIATKLGEVWKGLDEEAKKEFLDKAKLEHDAYELRLVEFQKGDDYKKYKKLSSTILGMGKSKAAVKKGPVIAMPDKPAGMPAEPKNGFALFGEESRSSGGPGGLKDVSQAWVALMAEGQKVYIARAEEMKKAYEANMLAFQRTMDGKKYFRLKAVADRKTRLANAKKKFLGGAEAPKEPKRPASSYFLFLAQKSSGMGGDLSRADKAKELTTQWSNLTPEEKAVYEDKAKELKDKYDADLKEYKNSAGFKAYERTLNQVTGKKAKEIAHAKAKRAAMDNANAAKAAKGSKPAAAGGSAAPGATKDSDDEMGSDSKSSKSSSKSSSSSSDSD